jgi:hypothetical protein
MDLFKKKELLVEENDSATVQELKKQCNQLIEAYNGLASPFNEQGVELTKQISFLLDKMVVLKQQ